MYQFSYAEIMEDGVANAKDRERQALDRSIELLAAARDDGHYTRTTVEALFYTRRVWIRFIEDLKQPDNELATELRADLISIAIWILKGVKFEKDSVISYMISIRSIGQRY